MVLPTLHQAMRRDQHRRSRAGAVKTLVDHSLDFLFLPLRATHRQADDGLAEGGHDTGDHLTVDQYRACHGRGDYAVLVDCSRRLVVLMSSPTRVGSKSIGLNSCTSAFRYFITFVKKLYSSREITP